MRRLHVLLLALALAVGFVAGYLVGRRPAPRYTYDQCVIDHVHARMSREVAGAVEQSCRARYGY